MEYVFWILFRWWKNTITLLYTINNENVFLLCCKYTVHQYYIIYQKPQTVVDVYKYGEENFNIQNKKLYMIELGNMIFTIVHFSSAENEPLFS
jgi:hypothetical protein